MDREIEIDGVVIIPESETRDQFYDKFIDWIDSQGYSFGGGINEYHEDEIKTQE